MLFQEQTMFNKQLDFDMDVGMTLSSQRREWLIAAR